MSQEDSAPGGFDGFRIDGCGFPRPGPGDGDTVPMTEPKVTTCNAGALASAGFCAMVDAAQTMAASRHSATPSTAAPPPLELDSPTTMVPANETTSPTISRAGNPSRRTDPPSTAISTGPMPTTIAAVPASTFRSPQFKATM